MRWPSRPDRAGLLPGPRRSDGRGAATATEKRRSVRTASCAALVATSKSRRPRKNPIGGKRVRAQSRQAPRDAAAPTRRWNSPGTGKTLRRRTLETEVARADSEQLPCVRQRTDGKQHAVSRAAALTPHQPTPGTGKRCRSLEAGVARSGSQFPVRVMRVGPQSIQAPRDAAAPTRRRNSPGTGKRRRTLEAGAARAELLPCARQRSDASKHAVSGAAAVTRRQATPGTGKRRRSWEAGVARSGLQPSHGQGFPAGRKHAGSAAGKRRTKTRWAKEDLQRLVGDATETRAQHLARHHGGMPSCPRCRFYLHGSAWIAVYGSFVSPASPKRARATLC